MEPDIVVLELAGRLVFGPEVEIMKASFQDLLYQNERRFILDLAGLEYIDSKGVEAVASCFSMAREAGGSLRVACVSERVQYVFKVLRLDIVLPLHPTVEAACKAFTLAPRGEA